MPAKNPSNHELCFFVCFRERLEFVGDRDRGVVRLRFVRSFIRWLFLIVLDTIQGSYQSKVIIKMYHEFVKKL